MHLFFLGRLFSGKNGLFKFSCEIDVVGPFDGIINFDDVFFGMLVSFYLFFDIFQLFFFFGFWLIEFFIKLIMKNSK